MVWTINSKPKTKNYSKITNSVVALGLIITMAISSLAPLINQAEAAPGDVTVCDTGCDYSSLQDGVDNVVSGGTITLTNDVVIGEQVTISNPLTIDGNNHTISPNFTKTDNDNNASIGIIGTTDVTINDVIIDGSGGTNLHGVNVYESANVNLTNVTSRNNNVGGDVFSYGLVVNNSEVTVNNLTTDNNEGGVNVDRAPATLTINGVSHHSDQFISIYKEDGTVIDTNSQYDTTSGGAVYTLKLVIPACSADNTTFDTFTNGSVDGQFGWTATGPYDQEIVDNTYEYGSFGCKSLRLSNAVTTGSFGDQTFSYSAANEAGETTATNSGQSGGTRQDLYEAQFDIASTSTSEQTGLALSVSPDRGDGSRMSYLSFTDTSAGIETTFYDVSGTSSPVSFDATTLPTLTRSEPHTIKFAIQFVDGPSNDIVEVYFDGVLVHTGTTWENYYRYDNEASAEQGPRTTDSLLFRSAGAAAPANAGNGFLFDNVSISTSTTTPPDTTAPTINDVKMFVNGVESTFMRPGDTVKVQATVTDPAPSDGINPNKVRLLARSIETTNGGYIDSGYFVNTAGDTYERTFTFPADGKYIDTHKPITQEFEGLSFYIKAFDNAENYTNSAATKFTNDQTIPSMQNIKLLVKDGSGNYIENDYVKPGGEARVEVEASDGLSGVGKVEFRIQDGNTGEYVAPRVFKTTPVSSNTYRYDFTVPANGEYINTHAPITTTQDGLRFWARAYDKVGNYGNGSNTNGLSGDFTFDPTDPEVSNIILNGQSVSQSDVRNTNCSLITKFHTVNGEIDLSATLSDATSGVNTAKYKVRKVNAGGCTVSSIFSSGNVSLSNTSGDTWEDLSGFDTNDVPEDGDYTILLQVTDDAGNTTTKYIDITVDNTAPTMNDVKMLVNGEESRLVKSGDTVKVTARAADPSNVDRIQFWFRNTDITTQLLHTGYMVNEGGGDYSLEFEVPANYEGGEALNEASNGNYFVFRPYDELSNKEIHRPTEYFTIDNAAPSAPVITTPAAEQYFNSTPITANWTAATDPSGIASYQVEYIYDDGHTFSGGPYRSVPGTQTSRNHTPGIGEQGGVTIRVRAIDNLGNVGEFSDPVHYYYDATAPSTVLTVTIKQNGNDLSCDAFTNQRLITVDWNDDQDPNFDHYNYQNKDGGTIQQPTASEFTGSIRDEDGYYRFRVQAVDKAGNIGPFSNWCGITLDRSAPALSIESIDDNGDGTYTITGTTDDDASDVEVSLNGDVLGTVTPTAGTWSIVTEELVPGPYDVSAVSTDEAGNTTDPAATDNFGVSEPEEDGDSTITRTSTNTFNFVVNTDQNANTGDAEVADNANGDDAQSGDAGNTSGTVLSGSQGSGEGEEGEVQGLSTTKESSDFLMLGWWWLPILIATLTGAYFGFRSQNRQEDY